MKSFFKNFFAWLLAMIVLIAAFGLVAYFTLDKAPKIRDRSYLVMDLRGDLPEYDPPADVTGMILGSDSLTGQAVLTDLAKAAVDARIQGIILKLGTDVGGGSAIHQEIRQAISDVRATGKKVYAYAYTLDRKVIFLAAACDAIYAPPTAYISFLGLVSSSLHVKNALEKLDIKPNIHKIKDYKSAAEMITRSDMSEAARENRTWILDDLWDMYAEALRADRGFSQERLEELMTQGLFTPQEALDATLVDELLYWEELTDRLKGPKDETLRTVSPGQYAHVSPKDLGMDGKKKIAVVHAQGMIAGRKNGINPLLGIMMGYESVIAELERARHDDDVVAVVFRVDSGGGDALGSDMMGHEIEVLAAEKPVIVSMVDVAASGGYHISYRASKLVADPMSITGSIGSISGKFNSKGFWEKLGITEDHVVKGPNALFYASDSDFTEAQRARFEENHWAEFNHWLRDVAQHRAMSFEEAEKLAHGRVWTGRQAKANGLIDEVGGLTTALALAKDMAGIAPDEKVAIVHYPEKRSLMDVILNKDDGVETIARWAVYRSIRQEARTTWQLLNGPGVWMIDPDAVP